MSQKLTIKLSEHHCRCLLSFLDRAVELYANTLDGIPEMEEELDACATFGVEIRTELNLEL